MMLPGFKVQDLKKNIDERGFFAEIYRQDWGDLVGNDRVVQANLLYSHPGVIRAWHRHNSGQTEYFFVLEGTVKVCAYDDRTDSPTIGQLTEAVASTERVQVVRVPGFYWHGIKVVGDRPALTVYCVNRVYDSENPDKERRAWNDSSIIDPRTGKPYDWNAAPHK